jgi:hypothetical protein
MSYKLQVTSYKLKRLKGKKVKRLIFFTFLPFYLFTIIMPFPLFAQQSNTIMLNLQEPANPSSFIFTDDGYWAETFNDEDYTFFTSQIFSFSHLIEGAGSAYGGFVWNGFTVCNSGDNANYNGSGWNDHQWGCMAGGGIKTDAQGNILKDENGEVVVEQGLPYLVGYWNNLIEPEWWHLGYGNVFLDEPTHCFQILLDEEDEYEAVGVYVNIHPWTYYANLYGDALSRPLNQAGDYFKLIIHGLNPDGSESEKSVEHFLAKYENSQLTQSTKWEWVDLSSLGKIGGFYCTLESSNANNYGPLSPMYFCMDKLQVKTSNVGIDELRITNYELRVYPNPTRGELRINNEQLTMNNVEVYDVFGRKQKAESKIC